MSVDRLPLCFVQSSANFGDFICKLTTSEKALAKRCLLLASHGVLGREYTQIVSRDLEIGMGYKRVNKPAIFTGCLL